MATVINSYEPLSYVCEDCGGELEPWHEHTKVIRKSDRIDDEELKIIGIDLRCKDCLEIFHEGGYED
jgi:hypothetical protein